MSGIGRRWHYRGVAWPDQRQTEVAKPLLGAERDHDLAFRVEMHAPFFEIAAGDFATEIENSQRWAVTVVLRVACSIGKFFDHNVGRRVGRIACVTVCTV